MEHRDDDAELEHDERREQRKTERGIAQADFGNLAHQPAFEHVADEHEQHERGPSVSTQSAKVLRTSCAGARSCAEDGME